MAHSSLSDAAPSAPPYAIDSSEAFWDGPTNRQLVLLTLSFWTVEFLLAELRSIVDHSVKLELYTLLRTISAAFGCLEFYALHLVARASARWRIRYRSALLLGLAALAGLINLKTIDVLQNLSAFPVSDYGPGWRLYNATYWCMMFLAWAAIYLALDYNRRAVGQERRSRLLEQHAHEAQLRALRFQIDPHFLFNTLNSVSALVLDGRNSDAEDMIGQLSDFFRSTLTADPRTDIPLSEEIALQRMYLDIEMIRFPNLTVEIEVHSDAGKLLVPALLLQPLVENAVKFAAASRRNGSRLGILVPEPIGKMLRIEVWDEGGGDQKSQMAKGTGTGLQNVRERLLAHFGRSASIELRQREPRGVSVLLTIPIKNEFGSDSA
ncbi:hypothetical protein EAH79_11890 [Sphingomonas koreensis]|nr:hypothetical protein EAH79_11890 [Sphingomonas koreensis]